MGKPALQLLEITKAYQKGRDQVNALKGVNLEVGKGEMVSITGPPGCGKTALLQIAGCLERPTSGLVMIGGKKTSTLNDDQLAGVRNKNIGFIFQSYNLLPYESALSNVLVALQYSGMSRKKKEEACRQALAAVGLAERINHKPDELSDGQRQRVAIARAIVSQPAIILADDPTRAMEQASGREIIGILQYLNAQGKTVVITTDDSRVAGFAQRVVGMSDGIIIRDEMVRREEVPIKLSGIEVRVSLPPGSQKACARCGAGNRGQARYCANCGSSLELRQEASDTIMRKIMGLQVQCRFCGTANRPYARFCMDCGGSMDPTTGP
jgi:putative ABC transport system ATP-binding protein